MIKIIDHFEIYIGDHFLPALINGDYTGLDEDEIGLLDHWIESNNSEILNDYPYGCHLIYDIQDYEPSLADCDIIGLYADCVGLVVNVMSEIQEN